MPDSNANVNIQIGKPGGVEQASAGFYGLAKAAKEAATEVKAAQSAGTSFLDSIKKQNRETRGEGRRQAAIETAMKRSADYEEARKQKQEQNKIAEREHKERTRQHTATIAGAARGGIVGAVGSLGGKGGMFAAAIELVGKAAERAAKGAEILNDSYQTGAQKTRGLIAEFVPLGQSFIRLSDAIEGVADAIARQNEKFAISRAQQDLQYTYTAKQNAAGLESTGYHSSAVASQRFGIVGYDIHDRTTLAGERAAGIQGQTIGAYDELTGARRGAYTARSVFEASKAGIPASELAVKKRQEELRKAEAELASNTAYEKTGRRDKVARNKAAGDVIQASLNLSKELAAQETLLATAKEKGLAAAQAENSVRTASVNLAKSELAVLQQQEARMRGMAQSAGAMSHGEFIASAHALKAYQENGGEGPPELEALAGRLAPDYVRKKQEGRGEGRYGELQGILGEGGFKDAFQGDFSKDNMLKDLAVKIPKAEANIRVTVDLDTQAMAQQVANIMDPILKRLIKNIEVEKLTIKKRIEAENVQRANNTN